MALPILLNRFDLTDFSVNSEPGEDGLVAEISASLYFRRERKLFSVSSGGSDLLSVINWGNLSDPELASQKELDGFFTTSVAIYNDLIAVAATPEDYSDQAIPPTSEIKFFKLSPDGELLDLGGVETGFLTDSIKFSHNGKKIFAANEGQPNGDYSADPAGSVSIVNLNRKDPDGSTVIDIELPELDSNEVVLQGEGIRFSGKDGVTTSFEQDAEPEYIAEAGKYLFVTLQENNAVARINLRTEEVEAYIGLGTVDYSKVSVDLDDKDDGFNPLEGQNAVGLRMPDGIGAWKSGKKIFFITANEGDAREYGDYVDEARNKDLGYSDVPDRLKLIVAGDDPSEALVVNNDPDDSDPTNDFSFESGTRAETPVSFGSRSLTLFDGLTGELLWDSWMTDTIKGIDYNTSLQNIAQFAGIYDDGRSDDKGVEPESVVIVKYQGRNYAVGSMERTTAGDKTGTTPDPVTQGGLLVVYDVTNTNNVDFVTYQQVSRSPEGLEIVQANQNPTGRMLLGVSSEFDSNSVEYLDFGALLNNGNGARYLESDYADSTIYATLPV